MQHPHHSHHSHHSQHALQRRYDTTDKSFIMSPGEGVCGPYTDDEAGACLWVGTDAKNGGDPATAGWLNGGKTSNCYKQLYIKRQGEGHPAVYARVLDACDFGTRKPEKGCFQIYLTNKTFYDLHPTKKERQDGALYNITWDFNNLEGADPRFGPV